MMLKKKILIVDDHAGFRRRLKIFLEQQNQNTGVYEADSEESAVETALKQKPEIVLLELQLPQMNGIKTAKLIKKASPSSKIIIMTMFDAEDFQRKFMTGHIDDVIGKNDFDGRLVRIVKKYLREQKKGDEGGRHI